MAISVAVNGREYRFTPQELAGHAKRELAYRHAVYPKMVLSGRMLRDKADLETAAMTAIVRILERESQPDLI